MFFQQPDGTQTHYDTWDLAPSRRDALLLHGNLASNRWWLPFLSHFSCNGENGRSVAVEWRGCGLSEAPRVESELHPKALALDVLRLAEAIGKPRAAIDVIGHSMGGLIGVCLALLRPQLVSHLVLIDPVGPSGIKFEPEFLKVFETMRTNRDVCAQILLGTIYGIDTSNSFFDALVDDAMRMASLNWRGVLNQLLDIDVTHELKNIKCPVLILQGEHDQVCPILGANVYREHLPVSLLKVLPNRGHCPIVEDPELVAGIVSEFLNLKV